MTDESAALLLAVSADVEAEHEGGFNEWYYSHVPRLLRVPGYCWGRRYKSVIREHSYLALYEISSRKWLAELLGPDTGKRPEIVNSEFALWNNLQSLSAVSVNVYEQIYGISFSARLMDRDHFILLIACASPEEVGTGFPDSSCVSEMRFQLMGDPCLEHLAMGPKYLGLGEVESVDRVRSLLKARGVNVRQGYRTPNHGAVKEASTGENVVWNIYRPIAKHWPI